MTWFLTLVLWFNTHKNPEFGGGFDKFHCESCIIPPVKHPFTRGNQ
jgi:hypothetical protein